MTVEIITPSVPNTTARLVTLPSDTDHPPA